jgi:hypothetical protein
MGSNVICGAWLYQAEMDGQGQAGLWGKVALAQQTHLGWWGGANMANFDAALRAF